MSAYDIGQLVTVKTVLRDKDGNTIDATVNVKITRDGATIFDGAATHDGGTNSGAYHADIPTVAGDGIYLVKWTASGTITAVITDQFTVVKQRALVCSLGEAREQVNRQDTNDDPEIREYLEAATDYITWAVGPPGLYSGITEDVELAGGFAMLAGRAVREITAVQQIKDSWSTVLGAALPATDYRLRTVQLVDQQIGFAVDVKSATGLYRLTYKHGYAVLPYSIKLGGMLIIQHLWLTQGGMARGDFSSVAEETRIPGAPFAIPIRASELLSAYMMPGVVW